MEKLAMSEAKALWMRKQLLERTDVKRQRLESAGNAVQALLSHNHLAVLLISSKVAQASKRRQLDICVFGVSKRHLYKSTRGSA